RRSSDLVATGAAQQVHIIDGIDRAAPTRDCPVWLLRLRTRSGQSLGTRASRAAATIRATSRAFHTGAKYTSVKSQAPARDTAAAAASTSGTPAQDGVRLRVHALSQYGSHFDLLSPTTNSRTRTATPAQSTAPNRRGTGFGAREVVTSCARRPNRRRRTGRP